MQMLFFSFSFNHCKHQKKIPNVRDFFSLAIIESSRLQLPYLSEAGSVVGWTAWELPLLYSLLVFCQAESYTISKLNCLASLQVNLILTRYTEGDLLTKFSKTVIRYFRLEFHLVQSTKITISI